MSLQVRVSAVPVPKKLSMASRESAAHVLVADGLAPVADEGE